MALDILEPGSANGRLIFDKLQALRDHTVSALVVPDASYKLYTDAAGNTHMNLPWINEVGLYVPDRPTELGGTVFIPDMPPHIDPHAEDRLKVQIVSSGSEIARFVLDVPIAVLDEVNELPGSDYTPLAEQGIDPDEVTLARGAAVCFLGSTTLHEFVSIGQRESYINSYRPLAA